MAAEFGVDLFFEPGATWTAVCIKISQVCGKISIKFGSEMILPVTLLNLSLLKSQLQLEKIPV